MSFGPQVVMPGAFHFEAPNGEAPLSGVHPGVFRPPISPSVSSSILMGKSTGSLYTDTTTPNATNKRKRPRGRDSTPFNEWSRRDQEDVYSDLNETPLQGQGLATRYTLAQIETPSAALPSDYGKLEESAYSDVNYRRELGSNRLENAADSPPIARILGGKIDDQHPPSVGWSRFAFNAIGGVVGKVWDFCTAGAFRGFQAGGGEGYAVHANTPTRPTQLDGRVWCNEHDVATLDFGGSPPPPGGFPQSDYVPYCHERETPEPIRPPAAKRRQTQEGNDELRKNWVIVDEPAQERRSPAPSRPQSHQQPRHSVGTTPSATRKIRDPVGRLSTPGLQRRHSSRVSHAGPTTLNVREPASFASPRSPVPVQGPSRLPMPVRPASPFSSSRANKEQPSRIPSPSPYSPQTRQNGHRRNHSTASAASAASGRASMRKRESTVEDSPRLDMEAKFLAAKRQHEDREADARINDFNARLKEMIRQGKEALGTKVEVEGDFDDWEDD